MGTPTVTLSPDHQQMRSIQKNVFLHFWDEGIELSSKYCLSPDDSHFISFLGLSEVCLSYQRALEVGEVHLPNNPLLCCFQQKLADPLPGEAALGL